MAAKNNNQGLVIEVPKMKIDYASVTIIGDTPLLVNRFTETEKKKIFDKQSKKATEGHLARKPTLNFIEKLYWIKNKPEISDRDIENKDNKYFEELFMKHVKDAEFGFPSIGIKKASATAAYRAGVTKDIVTALGFFHIKGDRLIQIQGTNKICYPEIQEDVGKIPSSNGATILYRPCFKNWKMTFNITYNANVFSLEQILNFINLGGYACGIGDWRPEKKGNNGTFHVATTEE